MEYEKIRVKSPPTFKGGVAEGRGGFFEVGSCKVEDEVLVFLRKSVGEEVESEKRKKK
ncbi:hypothetical protein [Zunongwangia sp. H14]|uniref:hypothetical protein n=1 Tax=Zunongwangia sp. H14 TaxID=3240792 RepID=UPI0035618C5C